MKRRLFWHGLITLAVLALCNGLVWQKERVLAHGVTVLLKLAPVDPRSLMQGDYMRLRYEQATTGVMPTPLPARGTLVLQRLPDGVATVVRVGQNAAPGELLLKFRRGRDGQPRLGAESFFFEEGQAARFAAAKYGELKVAPDGSSVLIGLRDAELRPLVAGTR